MFSFHMDNTAYASHFSVQRDLWKRERRQKNYFKGNMLKKEKLVWGFGFFFWFDIFLHVVAFIPVDIYNYPLGGQGKLSRIKNTDAVIYTLWGKFLSCITKS